MLLLSFNNILTHFPPWKVQFDYMNCNLIMKASAGISAAAFSKMSNHESQKFVIAQFA